MTLADQVSYSHWSKLKNPERCKIAAQIILENDPDRIHRAISGPGIADRYWALENSCFDILMNARSQIPNDFDFYRNKKRIAVAVLRQMGATL